MSGQIFVISAPSGTGKTTVIGEVLKQRKSLDLIISTTTRSPRGSEKDGVDYHFVDHDTFKDMIKKGSFFEWAEVHGQYYGTPKKDVEKGLAENKRVMLDIDTKGAQEVKKRYPKAVLIFLVPPSFDELVRRLESRGTNTKDDIEHRVANAREEMVRRHEYDYQVVNDNIDDAVSEVLEIIDHHTS